MPRLAPRPPVPARRRRVALQLGMHWFTQRAGGLDRYVASIAAHRPADWDHRVLALRMSPCDDGVPPFVNFYARGSDGILDRRRALCDAYRSAVAEHRPDIVVSHFAQVAHPVRRQLGHDAPHLVHFHGPWGRESLAEGAHPAKAMFKEWMERRVYRSADRLICLSHAFARLLARQFHVDPNRIVVIPGGVDAGAFDVPFDRRAARGLLGWPRDRPTVVCVRRLIRRMGLETLVDAAAQLRQRLPDACVRIYGAGPLAGHLADRVRAWGLEETVTLGGFVPDRDLPLIYRAADVGIMPSESLEGFGLATLECLAAGTPCLVTPVGGLPESVSELAASLVLGDTDAATIAAALGDALTGRRSLPTAAACRDHVAGRFDWSMIARRVHDAYDETITRS